MLMHQPLSEAPVQVTIYDRLMFDADDEPVRAFQPRVQSPCYGVVVEQGSADEIFGNPQTEYTKTLIAAAFDLDSIVGERSPRSRAKMV